jgi:hypothetical protein
MVTGAQLLALAETRLGEKYVNVQVPKDNRNWHGPWDCAEFASWLVISGVGKLYGCIDDAPIPRWQTPIRARGCATPSRES